MPWAVTTPMPTVVFPDTREGHRDWERWEKSEITRPWFCNSYSSADRTGRGSCRNRERNAYDNKNACCRCVAGFVFDYEHSLSAEEGSPWD